MRSILDLSPEIAVIAWEMDHSFDNTAFNRYCDLMEAEERGAKHGPETQKKIAEYEATTCKLKFHLLSVVIFNMKTKKRAPVAIHGNKMEPILKAIEDLRRANDGKEINMLDYYAQL